MCWYAVKKLLSHLLTVAVAEWLSGYLVGLKQRSCSTLDPVISWMGDRLWVGKPSRYVASHLGQLSLSSLQGR